MGQKKRGGGLSIVFYTQNQGTFGPKTGRGETFREGKLTLIDSTKYVSFGGAGGMVTDFMPETVLC